MNFSRITIFSGHYGSGKTNIAVNYALLIKKQYDNVVIADLDIVNPYFRTKDSEQVLNENGIKLIASEYANSNVDLPALPAETYSIIDNPSIMAVVDVGGDDRGALALGRYAPAIKKEDNYEMLFVISRFRPLTRDVESTLEVMREVENACGIKITGIVNNSNLGDETTAENVLSSVEYGKAVASAAGVPLKMTVCADYLFSELDGKIENLVPIGLYVKQSRTIQEEI